MSAESESKYGEYVNYDINDKEKINDYLSTHSHVNIGSDFKRACKIREILGEKYIYKQIDSEWGEDYVIRKQQRKN